MTRQTAADDHDHWITNDVRHTTTRSRVFLLRMNDAVLGAFGTRERADDEAAKVRACHGKSWEQITRNMWWCGATRLSIEFHDLHE